MSLVAWPSADLPIPSLRFTLGNEPSIIRTQMASGRFRQRKRFTAEQRPMTAQWRFTEAQFRIFQGWFKFKINSGADFFTMELLLGDGLESYTIRFTDTAYSATYNEPFWDVSAELESEDPNIITESQLDALLT